MPERNSLLGQGAYDSQEDLSMGELGPLVNSAFCVQHHMLDYVKGSCREKKMERKGDLV